MISALSAALSRSFDIKAVQSSVRPSGLVSPELAAAVTADLGAPAAKCPLPALLR